MSAKIHFINSNKMDSTSYLDITVAFEGRYAKAAQAFKDGGYDHLATFEGFGVDDLETLFHATQNGVATDSWSLNPLFPDRMSIHGTFFMKDGQAYGFRSMSVGDIIEIDGTFHLVDSFGFKQLEM